MMNNKRTSRENVRRLSLAAILTAIVFVLQMLGSLTKIGLFSSAALVLIPIVVGAALLGWQYGGWLGLVFAAAVLISGDAAPFLAVSVPGTIVTVALKGVLAGAASAGVYVLVSKKNSTLAAILAAVTCPIVNTSIFLIGCRTFFWSTLSQWASALNITSVSYYAVFVLVGVSFLIELGLSLVLSPLAIRVIQIGKKKFQF